jgi:hypothetical protein
VLPFDLRRAGGVALVCPAVGAYLVARWHQPRFDRGAGLATAVALLVFVVAAATLPSRRRALRVVRACVVAAAMGAAWYVVFFRGGDAALPIAVSAVSILLSPSWRSFGDGEREDRAPED